MGERCSATRVGTVGLHDPCGSCYVWRNNLLRYTLSLSLPGGVTIMGPQLGMAEQATLMASTTIACRLLGEALYVKPFAGTWLIRAN